MPLLDSQREYIQSVIGHLVDDSLASKIPDLILAFENKLDAIHALVDLQNCIHDPETFVRRVEEYNPKITVGEVQEYIFDYTEKCLKSSAAIFPPEWNKEKLLQTVKSHHDFNKPFSSNKLTVAPDDHPWDIPRDDHRILYLHLLENKSEVPDFELTVSLSKNDEEKRFIPSVTPPGPAPSNYSEEVRLREIIKSTAIEMSDIMAGDIAIDYLIDKKAVQAADMDYVKTHFNIDEIRYLLTYKYYFNLILNSKNDNAKKQPQANEVKEPENNSNKVGDFFKIWDITPNDTEILVMPAIIVLLESGILDISTVRSLTDAQINLLTHPHYYPKFLNFEMDYHLHDDVCRNLIHPALISLQLRKIIDLKAAQQISKYALDVLENEFYFDLIKNGKMSVQQLNSINKGLSQFLLAPMIINEIGSGKLNLNSIFNSPSRIYSLFESNIVVVLFNEKILSLKDLEKIPLRPLQEIRLLSGGDQVNREELESIHAMLESSKDRELIKKVVKDFVELADRSILYLTDLVTILKNIKKIKTEHILKNDQENFTNVLLQYPIARQCAEYNLQNRLGKILEKRPMQLKGEKLDNENYLRECIHFSEIVIPLLSRRELVKQIKRALDGLSIISFKDLIVMGKKWDLTTEWLWTQIFNIRLSDLLHGRMSRLNSVTNNVDSYEKVHSDLKEIPLEEKLEAEKFQINIYEYFLIYSLKKFVIYNGDLDNAQSPKFYKEIYEKIITTEQYLNNETNAGLKLKSLIEVLGQIIQIAKNKSRELNMKETITTIELKTLNNEKKDVPAEPALATKKVRIHRFSFFGVTNPGDGSLMQNFCEQLVGLEKLHPGLKTETVITIKPEVKAEPKKLNLDFKI